MDELVQRLSERTHAVTIGGPKPLLEEFQTSISTFDSRDKLLRSQF